MTSQLTLILLGPPGAGKGTQAARLREELSLRHLAAGDLLRRHRDRATPLGRQAARYMAAGQLVPDELVVALILGEIEQENAGGVLLDGFPRTPAQAEALEEEMSAASRQLSAVVLLDVPEAVLLERIAGRRQCSEGHVYDASAAGDVCEIDGRPLLQREDDRIEVARERLRVYRRETAPLVDFYAARGLLRCVDGTRTPDEVYAALRAMLDQAAPVP